MSLMKNLEENELKEAIVRAVAYFDMFDFPLTVNEIWQFLDKKYELFDVVKILESNKSNDFINRLTQRSSIQQKNGFYFLEGREDLVGIRQQRYNLADRKFKRALLITKIFKIIPWIKMIAVTNIFGPHNLKKESDIDFFIITEKKRIWLTRFFCVSIISLLGLRPSPNNLEDKMCLNCYVSEDALNLEKLMLPISRLIQFNSSNEKVEIDLADINFIYWIAGFVPIYNIGETYKKFLKNNLWLKKYLPNWQAPMPSSKRNAGRGLTLFYHDLVDLLIGGLEKNIKSLQLKLIPFEMKNLMNQDTRVVMRDDILKLHVNDRREEYRQAYRDKIQKLKV